MIRKIVFVSGAAIVFLGLLVLGAVGWVGSERALHPGYYHYKWSLASFPDLHPENISIQSTTGVTLRGRFFPNEGRSLIVLASGYGDTQEQMLPFAEFLHKAGYN